MFTIQPLSRPTAGSRVSAAANFGRLGRTRRECRFLSQLEIGFSPRWLENGEVWSIRLWRCYSLLFLENMEVWIIRLWHCYSLLFLPCLISLFTFYFHFSLVSSPILPFNPRLPSTPHHHHLGPLLVSEAESIEADQSWIWTFKTVRSRTILLVSSQSLAHCYSNFKET